MIQILRNTVKWFGQHTLQTGILLSHNLSDKSMTPNRMIKELHHEWHRPISGVAQAHDPESSRRIKVIIIFLLQLLVRLVGCHLYPVVQPAARALHTNQQVSTWTKTRLKLDGKLWTFCLKGGCADISTMHIKLTYTTWNYLDDAFFSFIQQFCLEFPHHLRVQNHGECPLHSHTSLFIRLLHMLAKLILKDREREREKMVISQAHIYTAILFSAVFTVTIHRVMMCWLNTLFSFCSPDLHLIRMVSNNDQCMYPDIQLFDLIKVILKPCVVSLVNVYFVCQHTIIFTLKQNFQNLSGLKVENLYRTVKLSQISLGYPAYYLNSHISYCQASTTFILIICC